jgi:predicted nuclease of predicted toxin-antitoxin system
VVAGCRSPQREIPRRRADARRLAVWLTDLGHDASHTLDLPDGNRTTDRVLSAHADREQRIVVTKDADFRTSHLLDGTPRHLLHVTTGNISNSSLLAILATHLGDIDSAFATATFVELTAEALVIHE